MYISIYLSLYFSFLLRQACYVSLAGLELAMWTRWDGDSKEVRQENTLSVQNALKLNVFL